MLIIELTQNVLIATVCFDTSKMTWILSLWSKETFPTARFLKTVTQMPLTYVLSDISLVNNTLKVQSQPVRRLQDKVQLLLLQPLLGYYDLDE